MNARLAVAAIAAVWLGSTLCPTGALAADKPVSLGVFLPTTMVDGQERFKLSEALGAELEKALGKKVVVKNFGRYEDFASAAAGLDAVVVDAWAAAELRPSAEVLALGAVNGEAYQRWAIISAFDTVKALAGKRLAVARGAKNVEAKFASNAIFVGDIPEKHMKLVATPNAESAMGALASKEAEAALVPVRVVTKGQRIVFRSSPLPGVVLLAIKGDPEELKKAVGSLGAAGPIDKWLAPRGTELSSLSQLITRGPPPKLPVVAESPLVRPEAAVLIDMTNLAAALPPFVEMVEAPTESPDD